MKNKIKQLLKHVPGAKGTYLLACRLFLNAWRMRRIFAYDRARFLAHSPRSRETKAGALASIIMSYHIVEKGLTMPDFRFGFGQPKLRELVAALNNFADRFGTDEPQFREAVAVVAEYRKVHADANFKISETLSVAIDALLRRVPVEPSHQIEMTRERYFSELDAPFERFSASRHSVRNFAGTVSVEQIRSAVALANNAPSACNRQYVRVHCLTKKDDVRRALALQNGNRGFGHLADKLLVLTADLRAVWGTERNDLFTNAGIYLMNLCYALHKNRVAHCMLNWSVSPSTDRELRRIINFTPPPPFSDTRARLEDSETIVVLIACGDVPEKFKLASSPRKSAEETLVLH